ncbi:hypothetical protein BI323_14705 [Yersinia ruckeri]|nr:hypothetical protein BI323_14705 [Yersinia ruckeri]
MFREVHTWVSTFWSAFSHCFLFLPVPEMVVLEVKAGMAEMVGIWASLVKLVLTEEMARTEAVLTIHRGEQDVREELTLMRTAIFISREQKNNAIQVRRTQRKVVVLFRA